MKVRPYLNFEGKAEEAFNFYRSVFGGEFTTVVKTKDVPDSDKLPENEQNLIMHIGLPIGKDNVLMASDIFPSAGHVLTPGNQNYIMLAPDSREDADRLFNGLSKGGKIEMEMADMFWGDYFGSFVDKFGIHWMISHNENKQW